MFMLAPVIRAMLRIDIPSPSMLRTIARFSVPISFATKMLHSLSIMGKQVRVSSILQENK